MRRPPADDGDGGVPLTTIDRRGFLRSAIGVAGAAALAACGRGTPLGLPTEFATASGFPQGARRGLDVFPGGLEFVADTTQRVTFGLVRDGVGMAGGEARAWVSDGSGVAGPFDLTYRTYGRTLEEGDPKGFYATQMRMPGAGFGTLMVEASGAFGTAVVEVVARPHVGAPGEPAPTVATPTFGRPRGVANVCTREPACPMHAERLDRALGRRPVVFTLASPLLCTSRTCGPVVDEVMRVRARHPRRAAFIHAEVWKGDTTAVLAPASVAWAIASEPWTFVIDERGFVRERFQGPVVAAEIEPALIRVL